VLKPSRGTIPPAGKAAILLAGGAGIAAAGIVAGGLVILMQPAAPAPAAAGAAEMALRAAGRHAAPPLTVDSVTPATGTGDVSGSSAITVTYSAPLSGSSAMPELQPAVAGSWHIAGASATFTPAQPFEGGTRVTVRVPGGVNGSRSEAGAIMSQDVLSSYTTRPYSVLRMQQILAQLGYLPLSWTPAPGAASPGPSIQAQATAAYSPPRGSFSFHGGYPSQLHSFWRAGSANILDTGAITAFQADHGLIPDGTASPALWADLFKAAATGQRDTHGYSYAIASQSIPESLTIWHNGRQVFSSPANTGIAARPTPVGTTPVYEKLPFQIMQGTNPDGSHYADPVQWVSYFNGGSAVHYFPRPGYGYPQSLGCVELPYSAAETAYNYLPYGTLVTVTP
jgi:peptidoglycan hydrolase-like protein with peptidoglycan-binding domain